MKQIQLWAVAIVVVSINFFITPKHAYADTYQIFNLGNDAEVFFYGMDDSGTVVLQSTQVLGLPCTPGPSHCYETFVNGVSTAFSDTPPPLTDDSGTPCIPAVPPGGSVIRGVCNGGLDAFTGFISSGQVIPRVYVGSFPNISSLAPGGEGAIHMNSQGDVVFEDDFSENWFLALDTTTNVPEPSSILLLGTGTLAAIGAMRRRSTR